MQIIIVEKTVPMAELKKISKEYYAPTIKGVVDIEREVVTFGSRNPRTYERDR